MMNEFGCSGKLKDLITNVREPIRKMRTGVSQKDLSFAHYSVTFGCLIKIEI